MRGKMATVSIDGINPVGRQIKKTPTLRIKLKGKGFKEANKAFKKESFDFGIIPAKLTESAVSFGALKTKKDGSIVIKPVTYTIASSSGKVGYIVFLL